MYILFFIISCLLASQVESLEHNFTYFSYTPEYQLLYILWFCSLGIFVYYKLQQISKSTNAVPTLICLLTLCTYAIGGLLPYTPNTQDLFSTLHVSFSIVTILLIVYMLYLHIRKLSSRNFEVGQKIFTILQVSSASIIPLVTIVGNINIIIELYCLGTLLYILFKLENAK